MPLSPATPPSPHQLETVSSSWGRGERTEPPCHPPPPPNYPCWGVWGSWASPVQCGGASFPPTYCLWQQQPPGCHAWSWGGGGEWSPPTHRPSPAPPKAPAGVGRSGLYSVGGALFPHSHPSSSSGKAACCCCQETGARELGNGPT